MNHGQIAEYGQLKTEQFSKVTCLEKRISGRTEFTLNHHGIGFETAGSCARFNAHENWSVLYYASNGSRCGAHFKTLSEAQQRFALWTQEAAA